MTRDEAKEVAARIGAKFARAAYLRRQVKSFEAELAKIEKEIVDSQVHAANAGEVFAQPEPTAAAEPAAPAAPQPNEAAVSRGVTIGRRVVTVDDDRYVGTVVDYDSDGDPVVEEADGSRQPFLATDLRRATLVEAIAAAKAGG